MNERSHLLASDAFFELKNRQSDRLESTYDDFVDDPTYADTCQFFFGEVYTAEDTRERDEAFAAFTAKLTKVLGGDIVHTLKNLVALQALTVDLDIAVFHAWQELSAPLSDVYEQAYYQAGHYDDRVKQIDMLVDGLRNAFKIFHRFGIGSGLKALHRFQKFRGQTQVTGFLVRGYEAIHPLADIEPLAQAIDERERSRLERIWEEQAA